MSEDGRTVQAAQEIATLRARLATLGADADDVVVDPAVIAIAQSSADNIMLLDPDGIIRFINWTVPALTPDEVRGTSVSRYVGAEFHAAMNACFAEVCRTGQPSRYETNYVSPEGEVSYWESRVAPVVRGGRVVNLVVNSSNVTAGRAAEADRQRFFTMSLDLLCVADSLGRFRRVNPAVERILGFTEAEFLDASFRDLVHEEDLEATTAALARLSVGRELIDFEIRCRCKDGAYRRLSWSAIADPGSAKLLYAVARDVTEQRSLEVRLRQSQKMDAIGQLAAGIAHDFNNILMAIQGNVHLALGAPSVERSARYLREIAFAGDRAAALTSQLLAFNRIQPLACRVLDLGTLAGGLMELLRRLIDAHIDIALDVGPGRVLVQGDAGQLEQVLINLCINARDAMPDGGTLRIEIAVADFDRGFKDRHAWAKSGDFVRVTVVDTGAGMQPEVQQRAFEPFFTTKALGQGTGLGLATVYGIVQQHAGHIDLMSQVGSGTSMSLYLPAWLGPETDATMRVDRPMEVGSGSVLVVEDDDAVRDVVVAVIEGLGYRVFAASHGEEARAIAHAHPGSLDVLVTDVLMPGMTGPHLARLLQETHPRMAVLFISGYSPDSVHLDRLTDIDAEFLAKPFSAASLAAKIRTVLDRHRARGAE